MWRQCARPSNNDSFAVSPLLQLLVSYNSGGTRLRGDSAWPLTFPWRLLVERGVEELKAVYLTAAIVGTFVVLWFPYMLGRILASAGCSPVVVNFLAVAGGAVGTANWAFSWAIYAAVSNSYRRAYRQMLIRPLTRRLRLQ